MKGEKIHGMAFMILKRCRKNCFVLAHFHNSAPNSNIAEHTPRCYSHFGAGHKGIKLLMCKHNVFYDLLTLASKNFKKKESIVKENIDSVRVCILVYINV